MADPSLALHKALYDALSAAVPCAVYDYVPQDAAMPYVTISRQVRRNNDLLNRRLDLRFVYLSIWSEYRGQKEVEEIAAQIDALNEQPLALTSGHAVSVRVEDIDIVPDVADGTFQGRVTLRIYTTH